MKQNKVTSETHHHWHGDKIMEYLLKLFIVILILAVTIRVIEHEITKEEIIYSKCVASCDKKHFSGIEVGLDGDPGNDVFVTEFDRTDCIQSCNVLYEKLVSP